MNIMCVACNGMQPAIEESQPNCTVFRCSRCGRVCDMCFDDSGDWDDYEPEAESDE